MPKSVRPGPLASPPHKPPSRFYGNLRMPPVGHAPGAVPEAYQAPSDPRKTRKVLWFLAGALLVVVAWRACPAIYRAVHPPVHGASVCCGCTQPDRTSTCPSKADCGRAPGAKPGCPFPSPRNLGA